MKNKFITFILMLLFIFSLASCNMLVMEEEALEIKSITAETLSDGNTVIVITYTDEEIEPLVFSIPKGVDGEVGNGILKIEYEQSTDKLTTNVVITLTDGTSKTIPVPNGISVSSTKYVTDEEGNPFLVVVYSNGTESSMIPLERGPKGKDGLSFVEVKEEAIVDGEFAGGKKLTFIFSDDEGNEKPCEVIIPAPEKGETGKGITAIYSGEDGSDYYLNIMYSTGEVETLTFTKPVISKWFSGNLHPDANTEINPIDGDYYFDTLNKIIYCRVDGYWKKIVELEDKTQERIVIVTLDLNVLDSSASFPPNADTEYYIVKGPNFATNTYSLPIPTRPGYKFAGWYAVKKPDPLINGIFTDITTVNNNITLYAKWEIE